ncbi:MAG TPA: PilZ domain-containing protein [Patescibacteria group bacterium]|nr:PilZ domain-containing protein [Patescibacteria group bacterium]
MQTVLLADDERVFKALEGTCLRREVCTLVKAPAERLAAVAAERSPDLIVLAIDNDAARAAFHDLREEEALSPIPIIALDFTSDAARRARRPTGSGRAGAVDLIAMKPGKSPRARLAEMDARLDVSIRRHLPILDRRIDRILLSVPVKCHDDTSSFTLRTKNISPAGLFLKTKRPLSPGQRLKVRFDLPMESEPGRMIPIAATCQVVRRVGASERDNVDLIPGVGVRFVVLEAKGRTALDRFVRAGLFAAAEQSTKANQGSGRRGARGEGVRH